MTWPNQETLNLLQIDTEFLGSFEPTETLYFMDLPLIFTTKDHSGGFHLAFFVEEFSNETIRYLLSSTSQDSINKLKTGHYSLAQILRMGSLKLVDVNEDLIPVICYSIEDKDLPDDVIPEEGVMLWPELSPLLQVKIESNTIQLGETPSNVYSHAANIGKKAFPPLIDFVFNEREVSEVVQKNVRKAFSLPIQNFEFASFVVNFRKPSFKEDANSKQQLSIPFETEESSASKDLSEEVITEIFSLFEEALEWLDTGESQFEDSDKMLAILQCLQCFTPKNGSNINQIKISSSSFKKESEHFILNKSSNEKVLSHQMDPNCRLFDHKKIFFDQLMRTENSGASDTDTAEADSTKHTPPF